MYDWLRYHTKLLIAAGLYYSGLLSILLRWRFRHHGVVLLYHRVLPATDRARSYSSKAIIVSPDTFRLHLQFLNRHFSVLELGEFREWLKGNLDLDRPPCLITFDDGWKDNLTHAHPLLNEYQLPAVIFLPTQYIGTGNTFWQERLSALLHRLGQQQGLCGNPLIDQYGLSSIFSCPESELANRACDIARSFKERSVADTEKFIARLEQILGDADPGVDVDTYLSWDDVRRLLRDRIFFGSHTVSHRMLTKLEPSDVRHELCESRRVLESQLGESVEILAYPNGNHNDMTCREAMQAGYQLAFTTVPGRVARGDDPMRLRRINIHDGGHRHLPLFCVSILDIL